MVLPLFSYRYFLPLFSFHYFPTAIPLPQFSYRYRYPPTLLAGYRACEMEFVLNRCHPGVESKTVTVISFCDLTVQKTVLPLYSYRYFLPLFSFHYFPTAISLPQFSYR